MTRFYAEFDDPALLIDAAVWLRTHAAGRPFVSSIEAYTPYPVPGIDRALGAPPSRLSGFVFAAGLGAGLGAYGLQWLTNAYLYPLDVGARPPHFPLAFVPITFEMAVLFAGLTAFFAIAWGAGLFRLWSPSSEVPGIESATGTRFWLEVTPAAGREATMSQLLEELGARAVHQQELA
jgi:hypothetical protein